MSLYESQSYLDQYLLFHYGNSLEIDSFQIFPESFLNFAERTVTENLDASNERERALDLGCSVGRSCFELSRFCDEVIGIDYSNQFIRAAEKIRVEGSIKFNSLQEGDQFRSHNAIMPEGSRPERISFHTGDALQLPDDIGRFDIIHAANLLCRLSDPEHLLKKLPELLNEGGSLVITTPCTWLGEFTPMENWPEGSTLEWISNNLSEKFVLQNNHDMPFIILEHARKFQVGIAQASVWIRNSR
ncbi:MAG: putative 4-mercaptohistidine N1-methyltransferase [Verrucomicrobiota bacterium]|nr:putative 4-mercaptohistidine N1-methyltransferase [Verrucomicrobiales bacterium]MEC9036864.1 putative 4-mercaptohistidine N1-methyltransferase [Verrucomicrobiota bacterium]MEE2968000.1 putative 4-mercaptohistidine N1-methyltransferase [Verrucomicrobiota bacterium]